MSSNPRKSHRSPENAVTSKQKSKTQIPIIHQATSKADHSNYQEYRKYLVELHIYIHSALPTSLVYAIVFALEDNIHFVASWIHKGFSIKITV